MGLALLSVFVLRSAGPRLLSSEYDIRTLQLGTIQHALESPTGSGAGVASSGGLEVSWQRYELLALDLVFDQPLYISPQESMADVGGAGGGRAQQHGGARNNAAAVPRSPHDANHTTHAETVAAPNLDGSIALDCGGAAPDGRHNGGYFVLGSDWGSSSSAKPQQSQAPASDYWSDPTPSLLPLYSPRNALKRTLVDLFDDRRMDAHSTLNDPRASLFSGGGNGRATAAAADLESRVGKPNVLSLMLLLAHSNATSSQRFVRYDATATAAPATTAGAARVSPLAHCRVVYLPVADRLDELRAERRQRLEATQARLAAELDGDAALPALSAHDREQLEFASYELERAASAREASMAGLTNFKGFEVAGSAQVGAATGSGLQVRKGLATPFVSRSVVRVATGLESEFDLSAEEALLLEQQQQQQDEAGRLVKHSPLDGPSSTPQLDPDDPFSNIFLSLETATQYMSAMLKPIVHGTMKPATKGTNDLLLDDLMTILGNNLFYSVVEEVAPDLSIMLAKTSGAELSNILQDSMTFALTRTLTQSVTANVAPYVTARLNRELPGPLHTIIHSILVAKIPERIERTLPVILGRVLSLTLTHALSRSIPHAVVPTLSHSLGLNHAGALSRPKYYHEICMECYMQSVGLKPVQRMAPPDLNPDGYDSGVGSGGQRSGTECGACPTSTYSMYYGIYHAGYYTDYYSEYYAEYYSQALQQMDETMYAKDGNADSTTPGEGGGEGAAAGGGEGGEGGEGEGGEEGAAEGAEGEGGEEGAAAGVEEEGQEEHAAEAGGEDEQLTFQGRR